MKPVLRESTPPTPMGNDPLYLPEEKKRKSSVTKKLAALLVVLVIFFFLGKSLYHNWGELGTQQWNIKPGLLVCSFLLLVINLAISAFVWGKILQLFDTHLPFVQSFKIMSLSGLGKYLPGKIWLYLGQIYLSQKAKIPKSICVFSLLLLFAAYNLTGLLVFIASLFLWRRFSPVSISALFIAGCGAFLIIFSPRILNGVLRGVFGIFKSLREEFPNSGLVFRAGFKPVLRIILILMADWMIFGAAVYFLVNSFYHIDLTLTVILCGIFAISSILGILSFFVPAGLGVREGVQSYLLGMFIPLSAAIMISVVMRVWMTLGELMCLFVALKIKKPGIW